MSDRIFKLESPHMKGSDVKQWQQNIKELFKKMAIDCPIKPDGDYGVATRSYTAALVHANGMSAGVQMKTGVTPELRSKLRHAPKSLNDVQKKSRASENRKAYRATLRKRYGNVHGGLVHSPTTVIVQDDWGYHPGVHDGLDVITPPDPIIFAMCKAKVIDVRSNGWWGLGAPKDPKLKAKGDGIIQLEVVENVGPFKRGMHIGYGHAEKAMVHVGDRVRAGQAIGHAGFANAWHIHLMFNTGDTTKGIGNLNPRPFLDYARKHSYS
jgi:murein DD-endopeptidase MepM/ murein hydrolase activator NlpD